MAVSSQQRFGANHPCDPEESRSGHSRSSRGNRWCSVLLIYVLYVICGVDERVAMVVNWRGRGRERAPLNIQPLGFLNAFRFARAEEVPSHTET